MNACSLALLLLSVPLLAQTPATQSASPKQTPAPQAPDPFAPLAFLKGNWQATTHDTAGVHVTGTYSFTPELNGHILARHVTSPTACKGPATFDCDHTDQLYIFAEAPGQPLRAIFFDNEGHVLHYTLSTPDPTTAVFLTDPDPQGPRFRLTYHLENSILSGKFQMHLPGGTDWTSYLEWSGPHK